MTRCARGAANGSAFGASSRFHIGHRSTAAAVNQPSVGTFASASAGAGGGGMRAGIK